MALFSLRALYIAFEDSSCKHDGVHIYIHAITLIQSYMNQLQTVENNSKGYKHWFRGLEDL